MYPYIVCFCGCALGHVADIYQAIKRERVAEEFGEDAVDPACSAVVTGLTVELGDVLDDLQITNPCCRSRMISYVEFKEVY